LAVTPKSLSAHVVTTGSTIRYTVPAATTTIVKSIILCNATASDITITTTANGVNLTYLFPVRAYETVSLDISLVMPTGQTISTQGSSASGLNVIISGVEIT
jgi:hypothetical protein